MSGEMSGEPPRSLNMKEKFDRWYELSSWQDDDVYSANIVTTGWLTMDGEDCRSTIYDIYLCIANDLRFVTIFALVHVLLFVVGMLNYSLKVLHPRERKDDLVIDIEQDNLSRARGLLGSSYAVARAAALVLHFDVAVILFRMFTIQETVYS